VVVDLSINDALQWRSCFCYYQLWNEGLFCIFTNFLLLQKLWLELFVSWVASRLFPLLLAMVMFCSWICLLANMRIAMEKSGFVLAVKRLRLQRSNNIRIYFSVIWILQRKRFWTERKWCAGDGGFSEYLKFVSCVNICRRISSISRWNKCSHSRDALKKDGLIQSPIKPGRDAVIAGVAYVGYARKVHSLSPWVFLRKILSFLCVYQCWSGMYKLVPCINTGIKDPTRLVELRDLS
jgi:hypothetical protein